MLCVLVAFFCFTHKPNGQGQTERKQNETAPLPQIMTGVQELSARVVLPASNKKKTEDNYLSRGLTTVPRSESNGGIKLLSLQTLK